MIDAPFSSPDDEPSMEEGDEESALFSPGRRERRKFNKFAKTPLTDDITRLIFLLKMQSYD